MNNKLTPPPTIDSDGTACDICDDFEPSFEFDVIDMLKGVCTAIVLLVLAGVLFYAVWYAR